MKFAAGLRLRSPRARRSPAIRGLPPPLQHPPAQPSTRLAHVPSQQRLRPGHPRLRLVPVQELAHSPDLGVQDVKPWRITTSHCSCNTLLLATGPWLGHALRLQGVIMCLGLCKVRLVTFEGTPTAKQTRCELFVQPMPSTKTARLLFACIHAPTCGIML